jgi:enoyl-CoA hydratase/carnithine racemase
MDAQPVIVEIENRIATVTLNRPDRLNAMNFALLSGVDQALRQLDANDEVRVVIVTGAGRAFCAGADLSVSDSKERRALEKLLGSMIRPWNMTKPVIAAINGAAVGGGLTMAMQFDIRFAAESARMGFVFVRRAAVPELFSTWLLPRQIGLARANDLMLSGRIFSAQEAHELGVVSKVWAEEELLARTRDYARDMMENAAPVSVAMSKRLIYSHLMEASPEKADRLETRTLNYSQTLEDIKEGTRAFREKRKADWRGKPTSDMPDFLPPIK